jgi:hypothetical protein
MKKIVSALTISSLFVFQSCALVNRKVTQGVPVTSNPIGARIIVDGKDAGLAPLLLTLKKNRGHTIRIEKEGYNPTELRMTRKMSPAVAVEILAVPLLAGVIGFGVFLGEFAVTGAEKSTKHYNKTFTTASIISGAVVAAAVLGDIVSGRMHSLSPRELGVTLTKVEGPGPPQVNVVYLDAKQLGDIQWIRIKVAGAGE